MELIKSIYFDGYSKLSLILREKLGLFYSCESNIFYNKEEVFLNVFFDVHRKDDLVLALKRTIELLYDYRSQLDQDSLDRAKPFYTKNLDFLLDDSELLVDNMLGNIYDFKKNHNIEKEKKLFKEISVSDLLKAAEYIFSKENMFVKINRSLTKVQKADIAEYLNREI